MHCDLLSATWSIALDDSLEGLAVLLPYVLLLAAEADILLEGLSKSERRLTLCCPVEKSLLLVSDECVENLLELVTITVCKECKAWERNDCLTEKTCLKP